MFLYTVYTYRIFLPLQHFAVRLNTPYEMMLSNFISGTRLIVLRNHSFFSYYWIESNCASLIKMYKKMIELFSNSELMITLKLLNKEKWRRNFSGIAKSFPVVGGGGLIFLGCTNFPLSIWVTLSMFFVGASRVTCPPAPRSYAPAQLFIEHPVWPDCHPVLNRVCAAAASKPEAIPWTARCQVRPGQ